MNALVSSERGVSRHLSEPEIVDEAKEIIFFVFIRSLVVVLSIIITKCLQDNGIWEVLLNYTVRCCNIVLNSLILSIGSISSCDVDMMSNIIAIDQEYIGVTEGVYIMP